MDRLDSVTGPAMPAHTKRVAVLVPCFNEEAAVATVVADFRKGLRGYSFRLPRVLAALRQIVSGAVGWFRDRNRAQRARAGAGAAGRRNRNAVLCPAGGFVQQAQHLARRISDSRHHPETLPLGKTVTFLHGDRSFPDAGFDRARDPRHCHLSRARHRSAAADRGSVDGPDDPGGAVGIVGAGARYRDARPPRDQAAGLSVSSPDGPALIVT